MDDVDCQECGGAMEILVCTPRCNGEHVQCRHYPCPLCGEPS